MLSDLTVLKLLKETVDNADEKFQEWLEENTDLFCKIVNEELLNKDAAKNIRWDDLIIRCEWKKELLASLDQFDAKTCELIEQASLKYPCQFDIDTLYQIQAQNVSITETNLMQTIDD